MDDIKFYEIGGSVRDRFLGINFSDVDYSVEAPSYEAMKAEIEKRGGKIYVETPEYVTIKANMVPMGACDFVLCRKDGAYRDSRHPESISIGNLYDDQCRRDFVLNSIAVGEDGTIYDPFNGREDIKNRLLRCVGDPEVRMKEDALRLLRAIRFAVTKSLTIHSTLSEVMQNENICAGLRNIHVDRIRAELDKCFRYSLSKTWQYLDYFSFIRNISLFEKEKELWLKPTKESR